MTHTCRTRYTLLTWRPHVEANLTVSLTAQTISKAKILAAKRGSSISSLVAQQVEILVGEDEAHERAERQANALLDQGFHLGGKIRATRDDWHAR